MKEDKIELKDCTEYLVCVLTDRELIDKAKELSKANEDLADVESRKKDIMADFTAQQKKHEANISVLSRVVSSGKEYREIKCQWEYNYTKMLKTLIRLDTMDTVKSAMLNQSDCQGKIALVE